MTRYLRTRCETGMLLLFFGTVGCESLSNPGDLNEEDDSSGDTEPYVDTENDEFSDSETASTDVEQTDSAPVVLRSKVFAPTIVTKSVPFTSAYEVGNNGSVQIQNRWVNASYRDSSVDAQFFNVLAPSAETQDVAYIVEADGIDECSLGIFLGTGVSSAEETIVWLNAGDAVLTTEDGEYPLERTYINVEAQAVRYFRYDFPEDINGLLSGAVGFSATGDETPRFEPGDLEGTMPEALTLYTPEQDDVVKQGPMRVEWSAGDERDTVSLTMTVFKKFNESAGGYQMNDIHEIRCTVVDDGEFEIPAALMDQLPADYSVHFFLSRSKTETLTLAEEFAVRLTLSQDVQIKMEIPSALIP